MARTFDAIVVGMGAHGSATVHRLASRGLEVLGVDQFHPPHALGSTHGETRGTYEGYWVSRAYVPIARRSFELWRELEKASGRQLFDQNGILFMGVPDGTLVPGALSTARAEGIEHEELAPSDVAKRWPQFTPSEESIVCFEPSGGTLFPEQIVQTNLELAKKEGAELHYDESVSSWKANESGVEITTDRGTYQAEKLVITAGAWLPRLAPGLPFTPAIERQILAWWRPKANGSRFGPRSCPVFVFEREPEEIFYGFADYGTGVKTAMHWKGPLTDPEGIDREVRPEEIDRLRSLHKRLVPDLDGEYIKGAVCMYTDTPDLHFLIDWHPEHSNVLIGSPCSGHGFKYSSALGEAMADIVAGDRARFDLGMFRLDRFATA